MLGAYIVILGAFLGSFLHTASYRLRKEASLMAPSACDHCGQKIRFLPLMPIIGFAINRGRTACCGKKIPLRYPVVEIANAVFVYAIFSRTGLSVNFFYELVIWESFFLLALMDFETMLVYWQPVIICLAGRVMQIWLLEPEKFGVSLLGLFVGAGICHFIAYFYTIVRQSEGLGAGDATLMGAAGFILGWQALLGLIFLSSILGILMIVGIAIAKRTSLKEPYPFGPAIIAATFVMHFYPSFTSSFLGMFNLHS